MGASTSLLDPFAQQDTWDTLRLARDAFGDECQSSPSLSLMAESLKATLSALDDT